MRREDDTVANEKEKKVLAFNAKQLSGVSGGTETPPDGTENESSTVYGPGYGKMNLPSYGSKIIGQPPHYAHHQHHVQDEEP